MAAGPCRILVISGLPSEAIEITSGCKHARKKNTTHGNDFLLTISYLRFLTYNYYLLLSLLLPYFHSFTVAYYTRLHLSGNCNLILANSVIRNFGCY